MFIDDTPVCEYVHIRSCVRRQMCGEPHVFSANYMMDRSHTGFGDIAFALMVFVQYQLIV